ncbi:MAG: HAD family phosphatase [Treponema sp.]|jgi:HAD superfamily hydrolase (TIGR01509 family)|nr:HAD family phosphatase [Treponema sp.]
MLNEPFLPKAVIFDMDGLLLDTEQPVKDLWLKAARNRGWEIRTETVLRTIGVDEKTSRNIMREECGPDFPYQEIREELRRLITETAERDGIRWRPGLPVILDRLEGLKIPYGLATSTARETALWKLEKAGLPAGRFRVIVCGDEVEQGKPAPDIFLRAAELLGAAPGDCLGFEDSPAGLRALAAAGIPSVFIKDLLEPPAEVLAAVWRRCTDLAEAASLIG